jgi:hypothetical protein
VSQRSIRRQNTVLTEPDRAAPAVVRSFSEANNHFHALAAESFGHAFKIQSEILSKTCESYISEISRVGRMFFAGYTTSTARPELPHARLNKKIADTRQGSAQAKVNPKPERRRIAAQSMNSKRKIGSVATRQSSSKRSVKAKRKAGSLHRSKG